jgi:hypothetical protein
VAIGDKVEDVELVNMALRGILGSWEPFVQGIFARQKLLEFDRIWANCIQEETRLVSRDDMDGMVKSRNDENQGLATCTRKGRKGSPGRRRAYLEREASPEPRQNKDLSRIK